MTEHQADRARPTGPMTSLAELKQRLDNAEPVVVDQQGRLHIPGDPQLSRTAPQAKTVLKPQRWFAGEGEPGARRP